MQVYVLGKKRFDEYMERKQIHEDIIEKYSDTFFISINDTAGTSEVPYFKNNHQNVRVLYFDDVDSDLYFPAEEGVEPKIKAQAFTLRQAFDLFQFIRDNKDKKFCIVHCAAGISRSGGIGTFINDYTRSDYAAFKKLNPYIHPNNFVIRMLKDAWAHLQPENSPHG